MLRQISFSKFFFSSYSNSHHAAKEIVNGKEIALDHNISRYGSVIQAFLEKRWIRKEEIAPKMYIIQPLSSIQQSLANQKLCDLGVLLDESRLRRMNESDNFNSQYLVSVVCEDHFKTMADQYLAKVLINGSTPPLKELNEYNELKKKILDLFRVFFYGDKLSLLEREIEIKYLSLRQQKYYKDKCRWTYSQQRRIESLKNWRARDPNLFDDLLPIFEKMNFKERIVPQQLIMKLEKREFHEQLKFDLIEKRKFEKEHSDWVSQFIFSRTLLYFNSLEFISIMNLPPDFHIENQVINLHIWILMDRLNKFEDTSQSKEIAKNLESQLKLYLEQETNKINLKKDKVNYYEDLEFYVQVSKRYLDYHFNVNQMTKDNHLFKLDAFVWTVIFLEKIPRYSDKVYMMAEYLKANYDFIQNYNFERFLNCDVPFDIYRMDINFKQKILKINHQLPIEEFNQEKNSQKMKKYEYSYNEPKQVVMPYQQIQKPKIVKVLDKVSDQLIYSYKKYFNLSLYDHFSSHEEQIKQKLEVKQKYIWANEQEKEDIEINQIKKILYERKQK